VTTELRHRLTELADDAPAGVPAPGDLWDRGRRYERRRRAGTTGIAVACVLLVSLVFGATWQRGEVDPQPAGEPGQVYLPDHFYVPSPWTTGTAEAGPLGRLVAIFGANRKTWRSENMGIVGVSATTGEYRFLDLPDYATQDDMGETEPSLSRTAVTSATGSVATSMESGPRRRDPRSSGTPSTTRSAARLGNTGSTRTWA